MNSPASSFGKGILRTMTDGPHSTRKGSSSVDLSALRKASPILAALLMATGLIGAGEELLVLAEPGGASLLGAFTLAVNVAVAVASAAGLRMFWRARRGY